MDILQLAKRLTSFESDLNNAKGELERTNGNGEQEQWRLMITPMSQNSKTPPRGFDLLEEEIELMKKRVLRLCELRISRITLDINDVKIQMKELLNNEHLTLQGVDMTNQEVNEKCAEILGKPAFYGFGSNILCIVDEVNGGGTAWNPCEDPAQNKLCRDWLVERWDFLDIVFLNSEYRVQNDYQQTTEKYIGAVAETLELAICLACVKEYERTKNE